MEFKVTTDISAALPAEITFNFDEMAAYLEERLDHYTHLVVTEDTIKEGKEDLAKLRKLRTAIDTRRKEVKKQWLEPYDQFEAQVKRLLALIDPPITAIDGQLKTFDDKRKEAKRQAAEAAYDVLVPDDLKKIIPFERIFDPRWLNATMSDKKVAEDIESIAQRTQADMLILDTVEPEYSAAVLEHYMRSRDVMAALKYKEAMQEAQEAARRREAAKAEQEAARKQEAATEPVKAPETAPEPVSPDAQDNKMYVLRLAMRLTKEQSKLLKQFLIDNAIEFEKI